MRWGEQRWPPAEFEGEFVAGLKGIFEEKIAFNRLIGLKTVSVHADHALARIDMKPELVGHCAHNCLHGGGISAGLDAMVGRALMGAMGARHMAEPPAQRLLRFARLDAMDLRVDCLRPGIDSHFTPRSEVLRLGSRAGGTRMGFFGLDGVLASTGSAAYIVF